MKFTIFVTGEAETEIESAYDWYEEQETNLGHKFIARIEVAYQLILDFPFGFPARRKDYRECFIGIFPFVIIYSVVGNRIIVYKVFHTSRNPRKKK